MVEDLGKRISAARAYRGMDLASLADAINITPPALQRAEIGAEPMTEEDEWALIRTVANATNLPVQFFRVDFQGLPTDGPPEARLSRLEEKADETLQIINAALERMDHVIAEAERQMTRGKEQLDRFIEHMEPDRELLRRIAKHLEVHHD